ncbi:hypothetical protein Cgig2_018683 [Carnegiea gigantea]|uniref:Uncharacterized protein n=1 Tax=Carnegiea gigantea TaxID=171969 RepID=A0A9Q1JMC0_9CARY|nr:hypothetical protein Cgig2_018683 [Carnegiea gigantea]
MSQHQNIPIHTNKLGADTLKGRQTPCKAEMPEESSKLSRSYGKLKIALLAPIPSRLLMHPRAGGPNGMRNRRNLLVLVSREGQKHGVSSRHHKSPSVMELGHMGPPMLQIEGSSEKGRWPSFSTPFSRAIMEALRARKAKMPIINSFDGTTDPDNHVDVYKA